MDPSAVLVNISQLIQMLIVVCERIKFHRVHWQILVACLKLLQPVVDEIRFSKDCLKESDVPFLIALENALEKTKELLERSGGKGSRVFRVICCREISVWFQEVNSGIIEALNKIPAEVMTITQLKCVEELKKATYLPDISDQRLLNEIESLVVLEEEISPEKLLKLFGKLEITCDEALRKELDALEKLKELAKKSEGEFVEQVIALLMQMVKYDGTQSLPDMRSLSIPADFRCPLSLELMGDPVIVASGQTYERAYIQEWLDQGNTTCPKTRQPLAHTNLIPNYTVKALIVNWCEASNLPIPEPANLATPLPQLKLNDPSAAAAAAVDDDGGDVRKDEVAAAAVPVAVEAEEDEVSFTRSLRAVRANSYPGTNGAWQETSPANDWSFVSARNGNGITAAVSSPLGSTSSSSEDRTADDGHSAPVTPKTDAASVDNISINLSDYSPYSSECSGELDRVSLFSGSPASLERHTFCGGLPTTRGSFGSSPYQARHSNNNHRGGNAFNTLRGSSTLPVSRREVTDASLRVLLEHYVEDLKSDSIELQRIAAKELRLLAKYDTENRIQIARAGAIKPLVTLVASPDKKVQENAVTALLNLSISDNNKSEITAAGAIVLLVKVLRIGSAEAKENSAAALTSLSVIDDNKAVIGASGAIPPLVNLLVNGSIRGKKDAATALFNLSLFPENKERIVQAGAIRALVDLTKDPGMGMVDKAVAILANLMTIPEGRVAIGEEGGIPALVEVVEAGSPRGKENAAAALLHLCTTSTRHRSMVLQEGAVPPLHALSQFGTARAKEKASALLRHFREQRHASFGTRSSQQF